VTARSPNHQSSYRSASTPGGIKGDYVQVQWRLPVKLRDRLYAEANRRAVSASLLQERALEEHLDRWEKQKL
jgi:hypothetical protein